MCIEIVKTHAIPAVDAHENAPLLSPVGVGVRCDHIYLLLWLYLWICPSGPYLRSLAPCYFEDSLCYSFCPLKGDYLLVI